MKKILILLIIITLAGCLRRENDLSLTVFIPDPDHPKLPIYSEWGYNTLGAYYNDDVFFSKELRRPMDVRVESDTVTFVLNGALKSNDPVSSPIADDMRIALRFRNARIRKYADMLALNDSTITLTSTNCQIIVSQDSTLQELEVVSGQLRFIKSKNMILDDRWSEMILSGTFEFEALEDQAAVVVHNGRFDVGFTDTDFR